MLINLTIAYNSAALYGGGVYCESSAEPVGNNLIVWGNTGSGTTGQVYELSGSFNTIYSCVEGGWIGVGNLSENPEFVPGPDGGFYLSQIAAGQTVQSPCVDSGDPALPLIEGTTRTDGIPDTDVVDMGYHYSAFAQPSPLTITLTPHNPPIIIPSGGGSFDFNIEVANTGANPETVDIWTMVTLPNGTEYGPIIIVSGFNAPANWSAERDRTQAVPGGAPAGVYTYDAYIGTYPGEIWDEDHFDFEKLAGDGVSIVAEWGCWGEAFDESVNIEVQIPSRIALAGAFPNPFNPATVLTFALPVASKVTLCVYDISGRPVAALVDGRFDVGRHELYFDGSDLVSGVYIYRLQAGNFSHTQKLVLLK